MRGGGVLPHHTFLHCPASSPHPALPCCAALPRCPALRRHAAPPCIVAPPFLKVVFYFTIIAAQQGEVGQRSEAGWCGAVQQGRVAQQGRAVWGRVRGQGGATQRGRWGGAAVWGGVGQGER